MGLSSWGNVSVGTARCGYACMPKLGRDSSKVGSSCKHLRCGKVPNIIKSKLNSCSSARGSPNFMIGAYRLAFIMAHENDARAPVGLVFIRRFRHIGRVRVYRFYPAGLPLPNRYKSTLPVERIPCQSKKLYTTRAQGQKKGGFGRPLKVFREIRIKPYQVF